MIDLILTSPSKDVKSRLSKLGYKDGLKPVLFVPKSGSDFKQLKKLPSSETLVIGSAQNEKLIRSILENKQIDAFTNIESSGGREHTHYRRSNVNQVLAKIAAENGKTYIINFSRILNTSHEKRSKLLGRIIQNLKIFEKYNVPIAIASFSKDIHGLRNYDQLSAFARVLGASRVVKVEKLLKDKLDRVSGRVIKKGVRVLN